MDDKAISSSTDRGCLYLALSFLVIVGVGVFLGWIAAQSFGV